MPYNQRMPGPRLALIVVLLVVALALAGCGGHGY
jgi:hypothetical protein